MEQKMSELTIEQKTNGPTIEQKTSNMNKLNENTHEPGTCRPTIEFSEFIRCHHCIRDRKTYSQLRLDLAKYLWQLYGKA
jgi:hypothetical protein